MPNGERAPVLLALQQTHGNRYVQRVVAGIQAKLVVGQPGDMYEQEADRVAEEVMRMPEPDVQRQVEEEEEFVQPKLRIITEYPIQRQIEEEDKEEEELLQTMKMENTTPELTHGLGSQIHAIRGGGQPLPKSERAFFEPRFGQDFSQVRVHTDARAADAARAVNAQAFTLGQDIVFGVGQYEPVTTKGKFLLAHELTHVLQQSGNHPKDHRRNPLGHYWQTETTTNVIQRRPLDENESIIVNGVISSFNIFEIELHAALEVERLSAPLINGVATQIHQIADSLPTADADSMAVAPLIRLYDQYLSLLRGSRQWGDISESDNPHHIEVREALFSEFIRNLDDARNISGMREEIAQLVEAAQAEREQRQEAQWRDDYTTASGSRISVGDRSVSWRVIRIHSSGAIHAVNEGNMDTCTFTPYEWFGLQSIERIRNATEWARAAARSTLMQFLAGLVEGAGQSVTEPISAVVHIEETLQAIRAALDDLGETGRQIWNQIVAWKNRFVGGTNPQRARMGGSLIGAILFEILVGRGIGRIADATGILRALRGAETVAALRERLNDVRRAFRRRGGSSGGGGSGDVPRLQPPGGEPFGPRTALATRESGFTDVEWVRTRVTEHPDLPSVQRSLQQFNTDLTPDGSIDSEALIEFVRVQVQGNPERTFYRARIRYHPDDAMLCHLEHELDHLQELVNRQPMVELPSGAQMPPINEIQVSASRFRQLQRMELDELLDEQQAVYRRRPLQVRAQRAVVGYISEIRTHLSDIQRTGGFNSPVITVESQNIIRELQHLRNLLRRGEGGLEGGTLSASARSELMEFTRELVSSRQSDLPRLLNEYNIPLRTGPIESLESLLRTTQ
jgi:hypothetical protein